MLLWWLAVSQGLSRLDSLVFNMHQKCLRHSEQDPGLHRINCCAVVHRSEVMIWCVVHCFLHTWHLNVGTDVNIVYTGNRPTYTQHMFACLCICWFRALWVLEITMDSSRHDGLNHPIRVHLTLRQTQLVEVVTWQVQYVKRQLIMNNWPQCWVECGHNNCTQEQRNSFHRELLSL